MSPLPFKNHGLQRSVIRRKLGFRQPGVETLIKLDFSLGKWVYSLSLPHVPCDHSHTALLPCKHNIFSCPRDVSWQTFGWHFIYLKTATRFHKWGDIYLQETGVKVRVNHQALGNSFWNKFNGLLSKIASQYKPLNYSTSIMQFDHSCTGATAFITLHYTSETPYCHNQWQCQ